MSVDRFGRKINYLRISLTDKCNLRCVYCMPEDMTFRPRQELLQDDEIQRLVEIFARLGFNKFRLTGGEPTVRANLVEIVSGISDTLGVKTVAMTTNGLLLDRLAKPLARDLKEPQVEKFFGVIKTLRDRAIFKVMLRCGLRVEEVSHLCLSDLDLRRQRILVERGKGAKGRVVYVSRDAREALVAYLKVRAKSRAKGVFLVEKGPFKGKAISVRGIQKRMEYYARKSGLKISCHQLRHTMATQMLNADAELETIQDLLGHSRITTTQRYCRLSNEKVRKDYFKTMEVLLQKVTSERTTNG